MPPQLKVVELAILLLSEFFCTPQSPLEYPVSTGGFSVTLYVI